MQPRRPLDSFPGLTPAPFHSGRTSIQVRCPDLSPLFLTLTRTHGVHTNSSHSGTSSPRLPRPCRGAKRDLCAPDGFAEPRSLPPLTTRHTEHPPIKVRFAHPGPTHEGPVAGNANPAWPGLAGERVRRGGRVDRR